VVLVARSIGKRHWHRVVLSGEFPTTRKNLDVVNEDRLDMCIWICIKCVRGKCVIRFCQLIMLKFNSFSLCWAKYYELTENLFPRFPVMSGCNKSLSILNINISDNVLRLQQMCWVQSVWTWSYKQRITRYLFTGAVPRIIVDFVSDKWFVGGHEHLQDIT